MKNQLVFPMAVYVLYIFCIAAYMFRSRVNAIKADHGLGKYFKNYMGSNPPERVMIVGRHYDNQFQVPLLFFITCLAHIILAIPNSFTIFLAWFFVVSRFGHTWIHLGSNSLRKRVLFFALGWIAILIMWAQLIYFSI